MILQLELGACRESEPTVGWPADPLIQLGLWAETDVLIQHKEKLNMVVNNRFIKKKSFPPAPS